MLICTRRNTCLCAHMDAKKHVFMCSYVREETRVYVLIWTRRNTYLCAHMYAKKHVFMCSYVREETRVYVLIWTRRNTCLCAHMYAKKHMFMFSYGLDSRGALDEYLKMFTGQYTRFRCQLIIEQRRSGESNLLVSSLLAYTKYAQTKI